MFSQSKLIIEPSWVFTQHWEDISCSIQIATAGLLSPDRAFPFLCDALDVLTDIESTLPCTTVRLLFSSLPVMSIPVIVPPTCTKVGLALVTIFGHGRPIVYILPPNSDLSGAINQLFVLIIRKIVFTVMV